MQLIQHTSLWFIVEHIEKEGESESNKERDRTENVSLSSVFGIRHDTNELEKS